MFCQNCGNKLSDDITFCPKCGCKQEAQIQEKNTADTGRYISPSEINRDITIQYLYDVRALEVAKIKLQKRIEENTEKCKHLGIPQLFAKPDNDSSIPVCGIGFMCLIFATLMVIIGYFGEVGALFVFSFVLGVIAIVCFGFCISKKSKYEQECRVYTDAVSSDKKRVELELAEKSKLEQEVQDTRGELGEAEKLLEKSYGVNLIPKQFRDIYSIFYLYEYLSTSQESLQSALLHYNLEEIKTKMDEVIRLQSEIILQQAIQTAHLEEIQEQNTKMLRHAAETERNTALAAQYAQIAANNAEACAWIGVANYIK